MVKRIAIVQSNYVPWRGYFDLIGLSNEFIILDTVQFTKNDWRNRNRIKTEQGTTWLTLPVATANRPNQTIEETIISEVHWARRHLAKISVAYKSAPFFEETASWLFQSIQQVEAESFLSAVNEGLLRAVTARLGLSTSIRRSTDILSRSEMAAMEPTERLVALCLAIGADRYLSGPAAKNYLNCSAFEAAGIGVEWMSYDAYPEYPQMWGPFDPHTSIIDLMFNTGDQARNYLKCGAIKSCR